MKNFTVEVKQIKSLYFKVKAKNKREAKQMISSFYKRVNLNNLYLDPFKLESINIAIKKSENKQNGDENMAYVKRVPPIKLVLTVKEYNTLVGILTRNIDENNDKTNKEIATLTKEKLLKFGIPNEMGSNISEIDVRLYLNEAADIITQLLLYVENRINEIDYCQVLLKFRESFVSKDNN